ncbi:MAG TPA: octaprenyl diphosphate synthase [Steroidobacteraceae bacterium]
MTLDEIRALVRPELHSLDTVIRSRLKSTVPLVDQVAEHIIAGGGKRLRPLLVLLVGRACGSSGAAHIEAAAFIEFIHTATLLHDDVVDGSSMRRGRDTANEVFGNQASVLVGDFVYSRAFQMMASLASQRVMEIMADATNVIAEGEVLQLMNAHDPHTTEQRYLEVIYRKTARLFEAGAEVAAVLSNSSPEMQATMAKFGRHLGTAYQLVDDVLDYRSDPATRGKNIGDDLAEGKPTLPLIHALRHGNKAQQAIIREAITNGGLEHLEGIIAAIDATGGLDYAAQRAREECELALEALSALPDSPHKAGLAALARFAVEHTT